MKQIYISDFLVSFYISFVFPRSSIAELLEEFSPNGRLSAKLEVPAHVVFVAAAPEQEARMAAEPPHDSLDLGCAVVGKVRMRRLCPGWAQSGERV